jgi:hypothetical protein
VLTFSGASWFIVAVVREGYDDGDGDDDDDDDDEDEDEDDDDDDGLKLQW